MARKFQELTSKMSADRQARVRMRAREALGEMLLSQIRKDAGLTQEQLARTLGIRQPTLSQLESSEDMQVSTLRRIIEALGGRLEMIARLPHGDVRLSQFDEDKPSLVPR